MWGELNELQEILQEEERLKQIKRCCFSSDSKEVFQATTRSRHVQREVVLQLLENVIEKILTSVSKHQPPVIVYNSRQRWDNVQFVDDVGLEMKDKPAHTEVRFNAVNSCRKFGVTMKVLAMCYRLVQSNTYSTKRDLYYNDTKLFGNQATLDDAVDNICCMLNVPRRCLHVLATSKGILAGDLKFTDVAGNRVDCTSTRNGVPVPSHIEDISDIQSSAKFVLVVEKDATFQKLLEDGFLQDMWPCILLTGKGFPDVNSRLMLRNLWETLQIPILGLVDADPHDLPGVSLNHEEINSYHFGVISKSYESWSLTVPCIRWLGVLPSDIERLQVPKDALIPLNKSDLVKAKELMTRPYYKHLHLWMREMQILMGLGMKAEIQCLSAISPNYLSKVYIPNKIRCGGWI